MPVFRVEDMDILYWKGAFELADYYITNKVVVDNRYYIDENKVLWGAGRNEYGQLGIEDTNAEDFYQTPVKIAEHVVTVDCSENGYFCVYPHRGRLSVWSWEYAGTARHRADGRSARAAIGECGVCPRGQGMYCCA